MSAKPVLGAALALCALAFAPSTSAAADAKKSACAEGQIEVKGACVTACPTQGAFKEDSCECPPKFAKVFFGNGSAECKPAICPKTGEFSPNRSCDCPEGYAKKAGKKGNVKCAKASSRTAAKKTS